MFALLQIALLSGYMLTCHYISVKTFSDVVETLLMWFGFCLPFNLHSVHLLWVKTVNNNKIQELCTISFSKDQHKQHTLSPFSAPDMITGPNARPEKHDVLHTDAHTKTPLDQLPKHFSVCVRAQTDPSHLWGDAFEAKLTLVGEIKHL